VIANGLGDLNLIFNIGSVVLVGAGIMALYRAQRRNTDVQTLRAAIGDHKARAEASIALAKERQATIEEERQRAALLVSKITELQSRPELNDVMTLLAGAATRDEQRFKEHQALMVEMKQVGAVLDQIHKALKRQNGEEVTE
jgi:hypothetical protein